MTVTPAVALPSNETRTVRKLRTRIILGLWLVLPILSSAQVPFAGDFQSEIRYGVDTWSIATGDFNGDGHMDFVASSANNTIVVLLGNGDGTFRTPVSYPVNDPGGVAVGDLNGDGKLDVVVANFNGLATTFGGGVSILFGNGDGTFQPSVFYNTGKNPTEVAVGDLNGDGKPDLVVTDVTSGNISVMLNSGTGAFAAPVQFATGSYPNSVAVADINRDGHNDVVVTNSCADMASNPTGCSGSSPNTISVLLGKGDGTFDSPASYSASAGPFQLALGDLNADGWPDAVVTNNQGNTVSVLLNKGDGTFAPPTSYLVGHTPIWVEIADFNGDGKPDLIATTRDNTLVELLGNGDGTFEAAINYFSGTGFLGVATADLNGDSRPDLIAGTGQFIVGAFLNAGGTSRAQTSVVLSPSSNPTETLTDIGISAQVTSAGRTPTGSVTLNVDGIPQIGPSIGMLNASGQASFDIGCLPHGNHNISAIYSGDTLTAASTSSIIETVNLRPVSIALSSSLNPSTVGATVTLTTSVSDAGLTTVGCPASITGTATFSDGGSVLGTSPVLFVNYPSSSHGFFGASLDVSSLAAGNHQISALYSGDQYFASATSAPLTQIVNSNLGLVVGAGSSDSATVSAGQTASYVLSIGGAGFGGMANISCSLAAPGANCLVPASMNIDPKVASNFTVTVSTSPRATAFLRPSGTLSPNWLWALIFVGLFTMPWPRLRGAAGLMLVLLFCGCGGSPSSPQQNPTGTPVGTYSATVVANSGAASQSITLKIVVQ